MKEQIVEGGIANFVQKTFEIMNNSQHSKIIHWLTNGKQFTIKDIQQFEQFILPRYFRHRNINSFIRQLNMYGFHKSRKQPSKNIFSHPYFHKDKPEMLTNVRRKNKLEQKDPQSKTFILGQSEEQMRTKQKVAVRKQVPVIESSTSIQLSSSMNLENEEKSQIKGLISRSFIIDINPEVCLKEQSNTDLICSQHHEEDDDMGIVDEITREREMFNRRTQGISIVNTSNFLEEFQF